MPPILPETRGRSYRPYYPVMFGDPGSPAPKMAPRGPAKGVRRRFQEVPGTPLAPLIESASTGLLVRLRGLLTRA